MSHAAPVSVAPGDPALPSRRRSLELAVAWLLALAAPAAWIAYAELGVGALVAALPSLSLPAADALVASAAAFSALLLLVAAVFVARGLRGARPIAITAVGLAALPVLYQSAAEPGTALLALSWAVVLLHLVLRRVAFLPWIRARAPADARVFWAEPVLAGTLFALLLGAYGAGRGLLDTPGTRWALFVLLAATAVLATVAEWRLAKAGAFPKAAALGLALAGAAGLGLAPAGAAAHAVLGLRLLVSFVWAARAHEVREEVTAHLWRHPALFVVLTFAFLSFAGGLVLTFPISSATGRPVPLVDAFFTATSACCVTGLVVLDTGKDFSFFGQAVILCLIQVGALGIMTLSAVAALLLGRTLGSKSEGALSETVGTASPRGTVRLLKSVALFTLAIEAVGFLLLVPSFVERRGDVASGVWDALFHSVSAFANAGFALRTRNLEAFAGDPYVTVTVSFLIVTGGIGFAVLAGLWELFRGRANRVDLHVKLALATTAALLVVSFAFWLFLEWNGVFGALAPVDKLHNAWFQAVTMRTAGFNTVDLGALPTATALGVMGFMFIGASPGSTGGGIKTTTFAVLVLAVLSVVRGRPDAEAFGRTIPKGVVYRAAAVATLSALVVLAGAVALLLTQPAPFSGLSERWGIRLLFETVSAFGTVGLSLGATPELDDLGKLIVMALMFTGRTGPLTMALVFGRRRVARIRLPEEEVLVG